MLFTNESNIICTVFYSANKLTTYVVIKKIISKPGH